MKLIIDEVWNASPAAVESAVNEVSKMVVISWIAALVMCVVSIGIMFLVMKKTE